MKHAAVAHPNPRHPLAGRRIVITRPEPDAGRLAARLEALGAEPVVIPAIRIEPADSAPLEAALARLPEYDWVIFTSKHGVDAVLKRTPGIEGPRIAAIGPATASALRKNGIEPDLVPSKYVAEAILAGLGDVEGQRFLLPRADIARQALAEGLRARGGTVDEIPVYHTRSLATERPNLSGVDAVTFTSSSTVRGFLEAGPPPPKTKIVCIGPITARTAREYGLEVTKVAEEYTEDGLLAALVAAFADLTKGPAGHE